MTQFFKDPIYQFIVTVVLFLFAIIVPILIYFSQRKWKALAYEIISLTPVLSAAQEVAKKLQIFFENESVKEVHILVVKLVNAGNIPITPSDYERDVNIKLINSAKILSAEILKSNPSNLSSEIYIKDKSISLKPVLLNPGDFIIINALISEFNGDVEIDGRIVGIKEIYNNLLRPTYSSIFGFVLCICIYFVMGMFLGIETVNYKSNVSEPLISEVHRMKIFIILLTSLVFFPLAVLHLRRNPIIKHFLKLIRGFYSKD